jgi:5,6,7,8-tetrahydromethanopterin hydro-lyase
MTWGPAQAGVAAGVAAAVADGVVPAAEVGDLLVLAAVWVDWAADDAALVYANNRAAIAGALTAGAAGLPRVEDVVAARDDPSNPFFDGP